MSQVFAKRAAPRLRARAIVLALGGLVASPLAVGQSPGQADNAADDAPQARLDLPDFTITGTPVPGDPLLQAADVDVLAAPEKNEEEAASLGESLDRIAGVNNIATGNQTGKPVLRGLSGERVRILTNSVGVDHQQYGVRHMPTIDPFLAERIEVVRGASSVLYGSSALGGAVNVLPASVPFDAPTSGQALLGFASNNSQFDTGIKLAGGGEAIGYTFGLINRDADNIETPDEPTFFPPPPSDPDQRSAPAYTGELDFTDFEQINGQAAVGWRTDNAGTWTARYSRWDNAHNFLLPPPAGMRPPPEGEEGIGQFIDNQQVQLSGTFGTGVIWEPSLTWQNNTRLSNAAGNPREDGFDGTIDIEFDQYTLRMTGRHGPVAGFDGGTIGVEYLTKDQASDGSTQLSPGGDVTNLAVFAFEEKSFGRLLVQTGLRVDSRTVEGRADKTANPSPSVVAAEEQDYDVVTGSIGGSFRLSPTMALAANISRGFRAPTLFELYVQGVHGGVAAVQQGNEDLTEETSLSTDVSLRWASDTTRAKITAYNNAIDDYIFIRDSGQTQNGLPVFVFDQGDAELTGLELSIDRDVTPWLALSAAGEIVSGELDESGNDLPLLPADNARVGARFSAGRLGLLDSPFVQVDISYHAEKDAAPGEPFSQFDGAPFGTASTDSYTLVHLGAGGTVRAFGRPLKLDFQVRNLLDETYRGFLDTYKGYALSPGRDLRLRLRLPFGNAL